MTTPPDDICDQDLLDWVGDVCGARAVEATRRSAGASRAGYAVDIEHHDGSLAELWLRVDTGFGPQSSTVYTVRREGAVYRALRDTPVRVAELVAIHPRREAFLSKRLYGRNWFSEITEPDEAVATARAFMEQLAALHAIDVRSLDLAELGPVKDLGSHVRDEIAIWRAQYDETGGDEPVISLAFAWLQANLPPDGDWPVVLVQGDTGPGNFMYADGSVVAVMDWEMAHWGDIHDDFAWICVRDVQERFTHLPDRFADYESFGGRPIDLNRLRYFRVLAQTRCAVGTLRGLLAHDSRGEIANHLMYSVLHLRLLADALSEAMGLAPEDSAAVQLEPAPEVDADHRWMFEVVLEELRSVIVPALAPGFAQQRAKGIARLIKYLRDASQLAPAFMHHEREELSTLLGHTVVDTAEARRELCTRLDAGTVDHVAVARYGARATLRRVEMARAAMGALADRRYSPIV